MHIWLIWATNVGKSTLFNRLIGQFRAIVTDIPGTTTDIIHHQLHTEHGETMTFLDSPGLLDFTDELPYIHYIIQNADLLLFVVEDTVGITAKEQHILELIRAEKKQHSTFLIVNKLDVKWKESETDLALAEYYTLGIEKVIGISAKTERNLNEIQEQLFNFFRHWKKEHPTYVQPSEESTTTWLAIVGKPNAWKSTLLNTLVGKPLAKVADTAGTTRDYLVGEFERKGKPYLAYDTAGIKKKGSIHGIEKIAYDKTKAMLEFIRPIVVFMVDCTQGITHRDMTLLQEIHSLALPIIFVLNKVDQVNPKSIATIISHTQQYLVFAKYLPIIPMVATTGEGIAEMMKMVAILQKENQKRIGTRTLNNTLQSEMLQRPPRFPKNKIAKILYATQIAVNAPTFIIFVNHKSRVNFAFKKWVENTIRRHFGFIGVPMVIKYRNRGESWEEFQSIMQKMPENDVENVGEWTDYDAYDEPDTHENNHAISRNPYPTKGKRKREKQTEQQQTAPTPVSGRHTTPSTRSKPKRDSKYSNIKKADQKKLNAMFSKVYGEKNKGKKKRR